MGWSNKRWVKGGFWAILVLIIQVAISLIITIFGLGSFGEKSVGSISTDSIISWIFLIPASFFFAWTQFLGFFAFITPIIVYFIIGAIIGLIVGKFKNKKDEQLNPNPMTK